MFAFAFNAKSFGITILVFFLFFLLVTFSGRTAKKLFRESFMISYLESVWPRSDSFLWYTKMPFRKCCSKSCYSRRVCHMTQLMHGNQHSKYPKKNKKQSARNSETKKSKVRLVIYPMSRNNTSLKIDFTGLKKWNFMRSLFWYILDRKWYTCVLWMNADVSNKQLVTSTWT